jgi:flagellar biosynthetic protein FlhB
MSESEDRTQPASKLRRQQARDRGQVAHSPELTTAAGLLATVVALSFLGGDLIRSLLLIFEASWGTMSNSPTDVDAVTDRLRGVAIGVAQPLFLIVLAAVGVSIAAHQLQVRGLWAPNLIAPDPSRLWTPGQAGGSGARLGRGLWGWIKGMMLIVVSVGVVRAGWFEIVGLSALTGGPLARASATVLISATWPLAAVLLGLGIIDYGLRYRRFETMLRTTADEQREDQRTMEGDPAVRAQRRQLIRTWRSDQPDLFVGASLLLLSSSGLTLVISGGPPPARVQVRTVAKGSTGLRLRRASGGRQLPRVDAPELARRLSMQRGGDAIASAELMAGLSAIWPKVSLPVSVQEPIVS